MALMQAASDGHSQFLLYVQALTLLFTPCPACMAAICHIHPCCEEQKCLCCLLSMQSLFLAVNAEPLSKNSPKHLHADHLLQIPQALLQPLCRWHCLPLQHSHRPQLPVQLVLQMAKQAQTRQLTMTVTPKLPLLSCRRLPKTGSGAEEDG